MKIKLYRTYVKVKNVMKVGEFYDSDNTNLDITDDDEFCSTVIVGLPGAHKKDINVFVRENVLYLRINSETYYREMGYDRFWTINTFKAFINLSGDDNLDVANVSTNFDNGLLTVKIPKLNVKKKKKHINSNITV